MYIYIYIHVCISLIKVYTCIFRCSYNGRSNSSPQATSRQLLIPGTMPYPAPKKTPAISAWHPPQCPHDARKSNCWGGCTMMSGWWFQPTPLKNISQLVLYSHIYIWKNKKVVPNHQPVVRYDKRDYFWVWFYRGPHNPMDNNPFP